MGIRRFFGERINAMRIKREQNEIAREIRENTIYKARETLRERIEKTHTGQNIGGRMLATLVGPEREQQIKKLKKQAKLEGKNWYDLV